MWLQFNPDTQKLLSNGVLYYSTLSYFDLSITEGSDGDTMYTYSLSGNHLSELGSDPHGHKPQSPHKRLHSPGYLPVERITVIAYGSA
jgi:hypothetical protein